MAGCIYGKNISLVNASFMKIAWTDLLAENGYLGDTRYLPCTKEMNRYAVSIISAPERARNSEWEQSLPGSPMSIWDTLLVYELSMAHQKGKCRCGHISPLEQASFDSQGNLESSFETLVNCMNTRSLACENKFRFSRTPPRGRGWVEKKYLAFRKNFMQFFTQEGRLILPG
jgi:hypothetical protein